ncbi:MAG: serine hydrolase [Saprospiraceae bacterium]|nr:serine hydrolase [Saprospiraceae bacterium]
MNLRAGILFIAIVISSLSGFTQDLVFPKEEWQVRSPTSQGVDLSLLSAALDTLASFCREDGLSQTLIIKNGYIIFSGDSTFKRNNIYSSTKSFTSNILGLLVEEGKCAIDDYASKWEPSLRPTPYNMIRLRHFASMSSGYNAVGSTRWNEESEDWSWTPYQPGEPIGQPGASYCYWDEAQMMFGRVLTRIAGQPIRDYVIAKIGESIGVEGFHWGEEGQVAGIPINNGCTGIKINAHELARFGWLYLNKGMWDGDQLISPEWVKMATMSQVAATIPVADTDRSNVLGSGSYGFNWWLNSGLSAMPDSLKSLYYASGFNNNMCFVIPEWKMVVVRMGMDGNPDEPKYIAYNRFFKALGVAVK